FLLLCLFSAYSLSAETLEELSTKLNGEWHGELHPVDCDEVGWPENAAGEPFDALPLQLVITDEHVDVLMLHEYEWRSVCDEPFQINRLGPNAVLSCLASREGRVESWAYSVTRTDRDSLRLFWYKVVNNFERPRDRELSSFAGVGTLIRAASFDTGGRAE
ncbi:MAG: hypothetical protein GTO63_08120, partial [Anaerolineae bacterium]|nr:hypothetical protein [Anaerolineae bacterium]NIN94890.1 hypothetical protein [Anaerolineae bacterium]